jgi:HEAT repeat protein
MTQEAELRLASRIATSRKGIKCRILLLALPVVILGWTAWLLLGDPREPVAQGHPLSYWLDHYWTRPASTSGEGCILIPDSQAAAAIRAIGTNAIPILLRMVRAHDSTLKLKLIGLAQRQNWIGIRYAPEPYTRTPTVGALTKRQHLIEIPVTLASKQNTQASDAFGELWDSASNAVPALIEIHDAKLSSSSQEAAARALGAIGPAAKQAVLSLLRSLADTNSHARAEAGLALLLIHAEPQLVVPALMNCLSDPHSDMRALSVQALGAFGADAQPAVPALIEIYEKNTADSLEAATSLGDIGPAAKSAIPALLRGLANTNAELRRLSILSLGRIHTEPKLVVPALMNSLSDTGMNIPFESMIALGKFGPDARSALPSLTNLLSASNPNLRQEGTNAINHIVSAAANPPRP